MSLLRPILTVGGMTMVSRVLGFARDVLAAAYLGAGPIADAFFVAFKFPNFFRRLFAEGAFNAAFVPQFAGLVATEGREAARRFAEDSLAVLLAVLFVLTLGAEFAMPWLVGVFAPGFIDEPAKYALAVEFTRITFPYLLFISLVSLQGGVLNSLDRFAAVAATPILLNVCLIVGMIGLTRWTASAGHAAAWGVALAGIAQFLWLVWACGRAGMGLRLPRPRLTPHVRKLMRLMLPAALGSGVVQVNLVIDVVIASFLPTGAVSYLYYADRLYELPLAVIGIAIGTAILPLLSRQVRRGEDAAALATMNRAIQAAMLLTLPATAALMVLARPIVRVLFERGAFTAVDADATALALIAYAIGLPAYVLIKVLTPAFYAREDTASPVRIAIACVIANTALALALMVPLAHAGIALATACSAWLNVGLLARALIARKALAIDAATTRLTWRASLAALLMALVVWSAARLLAAPLAGGEVARAAALAAIVAAGMAAYGALALTLGAARLADLRRLVKRGD
jgi:putative peptidoglycan lipid II flippase